MDRTAFYSTAAQVIPVLWVILVFQLGLFFPSEKGYLALEAGEEHHKLPWVLAAAFALMGLLMLAGEQTAIGVLSSDSRPSGFQHDLVLAATWVGTFWVFFLPTQPWVETTFDRTPFGRLKFRLWRRFGWKGKDPWLKDQDRKHSENH